MKSDNLSIAYKWIFGSESAVLLFLDALGDHLLQHADDGGEPGQADHDPHAHQQAVQRPRPARARPVYTQTKESRSSKSTESICQIVPSYESFIALVNILNIDSYYASTSVYLMTRRQSKIHIDLWKYI